MNYRVTCLTPTLVGDGQRLSPIDYMVWKDHVNVLDQRRIFRLLAKGPRLEGYLSQLKKADKLDFGSWGGFAQNYAGRRIPFEHPGSAQYWEKARAEHLFIPTFSTGPSGPYLPGTAIKGALRTGVVHGRMTERSLQDISARATSEGRMARRPAISVEDAALGSGGADSMRVMSASDSNTIPENSFKIYLLRVATLAPRGAGKFELAWKQSPSGSVKRPEDSTPTFAEMAVPGTTFEGGWHENGFLSQPETAKALRKRDRFDLPSMFGLVNAYTEQLLHLQTQYADWAGLALLKSTIEQLEARLKEVRGADRGCVFPLGWGAGFLSKTAYLNTQDDAYRQILKQVGFYARAIQSGLPFPKTRRIVFLAGQPATLAGFVHLEIGR
ncbi:MAG TPA: type III-A CRISPR-associated RAMP protein Csm5 [Bryobacteraceae bacterium]|jgi:CRISPR-associated protein Csm5|nr:type III-A CRISPR-associated RAMP protein Csm5 [Bryobacteraceae bacterium]